MGRQGHGVESGSRRAIERAPGIAKRSVILLAVCVVVGAAVPVTLAAEVPAGPDDARDAAIHRVLDQYMAALNALDLEAHVETYHFPHFRFASGKIVVWQTPEEAIPLLKAPEAERRRNLRQVLEPDWFRSAWTRREIVQGDAGKVHVVTRFDRLREDGSVIKSFDSLYVMTFEAGRWGIRGRSSFAP